MMRKFSLLRKARDSGILVSLSKQCQTQCSLNAKYVYTQKSAVTDVPFGVTKRIDENFSRNYASDQPPIVNAGLVQQSTQDFLLFKSSDSLLRKISDSVDFDELFFVLAENENKLNYKHVSQAVWTVYGIGKSWITSENGQMIDDVEYTDLRNSIGIKLSNHPDFHFLLDLVSKNLPNMENEVLVKVFLALSWLMVPVSERLNTDFYSALTDGLSELSSESLALVSTAVRYHREIISSSKNFMLGLLLNAAAKRLDVCTSIDELQNLAVVFYRTSYLLQDEVITSFKTQLEKLLSPDKVGAIEAKCLLRFLQFLAVHRDKSIHEIGSRILEILEPRIDELHPYELIWLNTVLSRIMEPVALMEKVAERSSRLLEMSKSLSPMSQLNLFSCVRHIPPQSKKKVEALLITILDSHRLEFRIRDVLQTAKLVHSLKPEVMHKFWHRIIEICDNQNDDFNKYTILTKACTWYLDSLLGNYRNSRCKEFETFVKNSFSNGSVYAFANLKLVMPFLIAVSDEELPKYVMDAVDRCLFSYVTVINFVKGIDLSVTINRHKFSDVLALQLSELKKRLDNLVLARIDQMDSLHAASKVLAANSRKLEANRIVLELCERKLENANDKLNLPLAADLATNFSSRSWIPKDLFNSFVDHFLEQKSSVAPVLTAKLLRSFYNLGFVPERSKEFTEVASESILRGTNQIRGLLTLQAALGLDFLQMLPVKLVHRIFSIPFLDQLDAEMDSDLSSYPSNVRQHLMILNRSVCLSLPEAKIPWFHEKYCQAMIRGDTVSGTTEADRSVLNREVYVCLLQLLGGSDFLTRSSFSAYYNRIDFEVHLSRLGEPLRIDRKPSQAATRPTNHERVAILAAEKRCYPLNSRNLIGQYQLDVRQLEMLGYRVVVVPYFVWNSMELSQVQSKREYLSNLIWPDR